MKRIITSLSILVLVVAGAAGADKEREIFEPGDHCVAYRTIKHVFFIFNAEIIGRSCEVSTSLEFSQEGGGPRIAVELPIESFRSGSARRDRTVADLLGAKTQPELRFSSDPIDVEALRPDIARGQLHLPGVLTLGGKDFPLEFPLEIIEREGRRYVKGRLATTFASFDVVVPSVAGGLIARPKEALELVVQLELERVTGLAQWAREVGLP